MIDFRYHVVSIVAVFLALALGLFIGSTSLRPAVAGGLKKQVDTVTQRNTALHGELSTARSVLSRDQAFENALEPYAVSGRLTGESVVVVSAPGADDGLRQRVSAALTMAGATVTGDVRLKEALLDPQQDQFLASLVDKLPVPTRLHRSGTGAERALGLLADVLGVRPQGQPFGAVAAVKVLSAFSAGKLLSVPGTLPRPATLAVLIASAGPAHGDPQAAAAQQNLLAELARDLDRSSSGTVVAGPAAAAAGGGLLDVVRADKTVRSVVSTVDSIDQPSGLIGTVLALAEQATGRSGSYGLASGADSPLPSPSPTPS